MRSISGEIVLVVDHHAEGLGEAFFRQVAHRIDPLEPRAVAEMEPRDRIDHAPVRPSGLEEIFRRQRLERLAHPGFGFRLLRPLRVERDLAHGFRERLDRRIVRGLHPGPEGRDRRQRHEGFDARQFAPDLLDDLLDQEIAEAHAGEPLLAVRDRIEGRGARLVLRDMGSPLGEQRRDRRRRRQRQRDLDEDQRFVDERGVEEGVAAPIDRIDPAPEVVPVADLVHRLVADDLVQDRRRRGPVDAAQHQEAAIEPGAEQVEEIAIEHGKAAVVAHRLDEIGAHGDQRRRPAGRPVQPAKQFLAARLRGVVDFRRGGLAAGHAPARHRALDPGAVGAEIFRQRAEECALVLVAEAPVTAENLARQRDARRLRRGR